MEFPLKINYSQSNSIRTGNHFVLSFLFFSGELFVLPFFYPFYFDSNFAFSSSIFFKSLLRVIFTIKLSKIITTKITKYRSLLLAKVLVSIINFFLAFSTNTRMLTKYIYCLEVRLSVWSFYWWENTAYGRKLNWFIFWSSVKVVDFLSDLIM